MLAGVGGVEDGVGRPESRMEGRGKDRRDVGTSGRSSSVRTSTPRTPSDGSGHRARGDGPCHLQ